MGPAYTGPPSSEAEQPQGLLPLEESLSFPGVATATGRWRDAHVPIFLKKEAVARECSQPGGHPQELPGPHKARAPELDLGPGSVTGHQLQQGQDVHLWPRGRISRKRMWPLTSRLQSWPGGKVNKSSQGAVRGDLPAHHPCTGSAAWGWGSVVGARTPATDPRGAEPRTGQGAQTATISGHHCPIL